MFAGGDETPSRELVGGSSYPHLVAVLILNDRANDTNPAYPFLN